VKRTVAEALLVVVAGSPAAAQAPAASPSPLARGRDAFELNLGLQASYDDNVLRTVPAGGGQYIGDATAGLGYRHQWKRSWLSLGGQAGAQRYSRIDGLSRIDYAGRGLLALTLSRRTKVTFGQGYTSSYTRDIPELAASGLGLPLVVANRVESTLRLERPLMPRWQLEADAKYERLDFPSRLLAGGAELAVAPTLNRRRGRHGWITLGYSFEQGWSEGQSDRVHGVLAGLRRNPPRGLGYLVLAGDAYLERGGRNTPIGTAELSITRRQGTLVARYDRRVRHAFGLGRQVVTDLLSLNVSRGLSRRLTVAASGTIGVSNDPREPAFRHRSDTYRGLLQWAVSRAVSAGAGFEHWRSSLGGGVAPSNRGWVSLGYRVGS
jgi:Putative beta-barrel porin 2